MTKVFLLALSTAIAMGCQDSHSTDQDQTLQRPTPLHVAYTTAQAPNGDTICFGGYGSSMGYNPTDSIFYLLTDRGPNVDGKTPESKMFPFPEFSPSVGKFKQRGDSLILLERIILKTADGTPFVGLPNREGDGVTGEVAYDLNGNIISTNFHGIDSEGLALAKDGTFWVSDEYAPFVMHFSAKGELLRQLSPGNGLPAHFALRRPNRGMEGLTISPDQKYLYGIMQSPLYMPDSRTKNESRNNRILEINIESGATREFIYQLQKPKHAVSEICALTDTTLLVLERDGKFLSSSTTPFKRIYKIDISEATDVTNNINIEMMSDAELAENDIKPVTKSLSVDIIRDIKDYSHDKAEGMALIDNSTLAIVNDDDFSVLETPEGGFAPKLKEDGDVDHATVYFAPLK